MRNVKVVDLILGAAALTAIIVASAMARRELGAATEPSATRERFLATARFAGAGHLLGPSDAPVKIVEFSDFQCSYCAKLQTTLKQLRARYPQSVAVIYRHYPLAGHAAALSAAIASECAAQQGAFEHYSDRLFEKQDSLRSISWEVLASDLGVADTARFRACRGESAVRARVDADISAGADVGVSGTPALLIGGRMYVGALTLDSLESIVRKVVIPEEE